MNEIMVDLSAQTHSCETTELLLMLAQPHVVDSKQKTMGFELVSIKKQICKTSIPYQTLFSTCIKFLWKNGKWKVSRPSGPAPSGLSHGHV